MSEDLNLIAHAVVARSLARQAAKELREVGARIDKAAPGQSVAGKMLAELGRTIDDELTLIGQIMIDEAAAERKAK